MLYTINTYNFYYSEINIRKRENIEDNFSEKHPLPGGDRAGKSRKPEAVRVNRTENERQEQQTEEVSRDLQEHSSDIHQSIDPCACEETT